MTKKETDKVILRTSEFHLQLASMHSWPPRPRDIRNKSIGQLKLELLTSDADRHIFLHPLLGTPTNTKLRKLFHLFTGAIFHD